MSSLSEADICAAIDDKGINSSFLRDINSSYFNEANAWKSLAKLPFVHTHGVGELNAYDIFVSDWVVFTKETLPSSIQKEGQK